jgi:hypothetical protein
VRNKVSHPYKTTGKIIVLGLRSVPHIVHEGKFLLNTREHINLQLLGKNQQKLKMWWL